MKQAGIKNIRLIATDVDGTLVNSEGKLTERTIQALNRLMQKGYWFTFATGRQADVMWKMQKDIPVNAPIICSNGGEVMDLVTGEVLYRDYIPLEVGRQFALFCARKGIDVLCRTPSVEWVNPGCRYLPKMEKRQREAVELGHTPQGIELIDVKEIDRMEGDFIKFLCWVKNEEEEKAVEAFCAQEPAVDVTSSSVNVLEIVPTGNDKGSGLRRVCDFLNISPEQACVFGDFKNDLPMFQVAGMSIAVANAIEPLKAIADVVTGSNDEDGLAQAVEQYFLNP